MARLSSLPDKDKKLRRLGAAIRTMRKEFGVSQDLLAMQSDIERAHYGKIERGEVNISILNLCRVADALECSAADILLLARL